MSEETNRIAVRIVEHVRRRYADRMVEDVRIGLGYVGVALEGGGLGVSALLRNELAGGCTTFPGAGTLRGRQAWDLLSFLVSGKNTLQKAIGLAAANALIEPEKTEEGDSIDLMKLTPRDRVAMVGLFRPLVKRIRTTGAELDIIERDESRIPLQHAGTVSDLLARCTVAIITATSLLNDTLDGILRDLGAPRHVVILGPSTPLCMEVFNDSPVTHLGGSIVGDRDRLMQIISEGGGTPEMRSCLRFVNITRTASPVPEGRPL